MFDKISSSLANFSFLMFTFCGSVVAQNRFNIDVGVATNYSIYLEDISDVSSPLAQRGLTPMLNYAFGVKGRFQPDANKSFSIGVSLSELGAKGVDGYFEKGTYLQIPIEWKNKIGGTVDFLIGISYDFALQYKYVAEESFFFLETRHFFTPRIGAGFRSAHGIGFDLSYNYSLQNLYELNFTDMNGQFVGSSSTRFSYIQLMISYAIGIGKRAVEPSN